MTLKAKHDPVYGDIDLNGWNFEVELPDFNLNEILGQAATLTLKEVLKTNPPFSDVCTTDLPYDGDNVTLPKSAKLLIRIHLPLAAAAEEFIVFEQNFLDVIKEFVDIQSEELDEAGLALGHAKVALRQLETACKMIKKIIEPLTTKAAQQEKELADARKKLQKKPRLKRKGA